MLIERNKMKTKFVVVSTEIMHDVNLNQVQKFLMAIIEQLLKSDNRCSVSTKYFSELIGIAKKNVSRNLNSLVKMGYISMEIKNKNHNNTRVIWIPTIEERMANEL